MTKTKKLLIVAAMILACMFASDIVADSQAVDSSVTTAGYQSSFVLMSTLTATGSTPGTFVGAVNNHAVAFTGTNATCVGNLEGSLDGANWTTVAAVADCHATTITWAVDKPVLFIRFTATTLTGGNVTTRWLGR